MNYSSRHVTTGVFYIVVILALIATSFTILHFKQGKSSDVTQSPSTTPQLSTTISINDMFCMDYICDYTSKQATPEILTYLACEEACNKDSQSSFFTFTMFRGQPMCYLLPECYLDQPVKGCQSGPKNCYMWKTNTVYYCVIQYGTIDFNYHNHPLIILLF